MKNVFYFLLGITLILLTSATTISVMTVKVDTPVNVKPVKPVSIATFYQNGVNADIICQRIREYSAKGYIVKSMVGSDFNIIVVMEKY
jgi:hypothetical protein